MHLELKNAELNLQENCPVRVVNGKNVTVRCVRGTVWLTITGEAGDFLLVPGKSHQLKSDGLALLEGMGPATIRLEKPRCGLQARVRRQLFGLFGSHCRLMAEQPG